MAKKTSKNIEIPKRIKIEVLPKHIKDATPGDGNYCPIALALQDQFGVDSEACVSASDEMYFILYRGGFEFPVRFGVPDKKVASRVDNFIAEFDETEEDENYNPIITVKPFTFEAVLTEVNP